MKFQGNSDATKAPLRLIYFAGLHPDNVSMWADVLFGINNFVWSSIAVLALVAMAQSENLETALEPWQSFLSMIQCVLEGLPIRYHKRTLKTIIEETGKFWKVQNVYSGQVAKECGELLKLADFFCKTWIHFVIVLTFTSNLVPAFFGGLPYPCYVPGNHRLVVYVMQMWATASLIATLVGMALVFVSVCAETVVQYRLLEHEFVQFGIGKNKRRFDENNMPEGDDEAQHESTAESTRSGGRNYRELVDHHNFLLTYCEHLRTFGNEVFVFKVVMTAVAMCAHLYITLQGDVSLLNKIKGGLYFGSQIFDFALFCVAAELVSSVSTSAGNAIYSSKWPDCSCPEMKTAMTMVLVRARKQFNFVGQGLVIMNLRTLTQVFKTALSFQAYLRTMSTKGVSK